MNTEFIQALDAISRERGIRKEILLDAIDQALISAFKRNFGTAQNVKVTIDPVSGDVAVMAVKQVVETVQDPQTQISLTDAQAIRSFYEPGDVLEIEVTPASFGRIAALTAKQVVVQRIREAERGVIYDEFIEKENEILTGIIQRVEGKTVYLELGRTEGVLEAGQQIPGETYKPGDRLKVYVLEVSRGSAGPQVMVSRTHPGLVKRLMELEVPEIQSGIVVVKNLVREAGSRTKVAVHSVDSGVEPVGACVGQRGIRIERIVEELSGEKIDVIKWSADPAEYITNALSPASVTQVFINESERASRVIVADKQLSLAIGKEGQNARLAARLTGWKIDIKSLQQIEESLEHERRERERLEAERLEAERVAVESAMAAPGSPEDDAAYFADTATGDALDALSDAAADGRSIVAPGEALVDSEIVQAELADRDAGLADLDAMDLDVASLDVADLDVADLEAEVELSDELPDLDEILAEGLGDLAVEELGLVDDEADA